MNSLGFTKTLYQANINSVLAIFLLDKPVSNPLDFVFYDCDNR